MYESFGFSRWPDGRLGFRLFVPDNTIDKTQYARGDPSRIKSVSVVGDFQKAAGKKGNWDAGSALGMTLEPHDNGLLFAAALPETFPDGFYQYKYVVTFQNGQVRWVGDPCTKYGGTDNDNSAFVVGGNPVAVKPLPADKRVSGADLVLYELMIDDFTKEYRGTRAPVDAVADKLAGVQALGVNAIEFMPWIAWPDSDVFSWGYDPSFFFSVESNYVTDPAGPLDKLARLGALISRCHELGLMVVLDIVLQHASAGAGTNGFPYYWLWQDPGKSPFCGQFTTADSLGGLPLDYHNPCTLQFVTDVCVYWAERFGVDGFRFDQVSGYNNHDFPTQGAPALVSNLKKYLAGAGRNPFPLILEDTFDYQTIGDTNQIGATHGWFDLFRSGPDGYLTFGNRPPTEYVRILNSAKDFNFPIGPVVYIENHDHSTVTQWAGGRDWWFRVQPYMIALATCPGAVMLANGQEFGRSEGMPEPGQDMGLPRNMQRGNSRPLRWNEAADPIGQQLIGIYKLLLRLRRDHAGLRSPNFYPDFYMSQWNHLSPEWYGLDVDKQVAIYHRWGTAANGKLERFIVALNFSAWRQFIDVPFPISGTWADLANGNAPVEVNNFRLPNWPVNSYWGCVFWRED